MKQILVFGDSITYGADDIQQSGWVTRLRNFVDNQKQLNNDSVSVVYNLGISGNTTEDLLKRFDAEATARQSEKRDTIILLAIGINDAQYLNKSPYALDR